MLHASGAHENEHTPTAVRVCLAGMHRCAGTSANDALQTHARPRALTLTASRQCRSHGAARGVPNDGESSAANRCREAVKQTLAFACATDASRVTESTACSYPYTSPTQASTRHTNRAEQAHTRARARTNKRTNEQSQRPLLWVDQSTGQPHFGFGFGPVAVSHSRHRHK